MLNIVNNLPEALILSDLPDCLRLLHFAHCNLGLCPKLSFVVGHGDSERCIGDELTARCRWWARRPRGDRQFMLPFPGYRRATLTNTYSDRDRYFEIEVAVPSRNDGRYRNCPRVLTYQPGEYPTRNTLSAMRIHGLTAENITNLKSQLGWR
jgi:hypothetical protein